MKTACRIVLLGVPLVAAVTVKGPLDTPDLTPYNPTEVLCSLGKDKEGNPKVSDWCANWLQCIKTKASPSGSTDAVKKAWAPASCKEICGTWPAITPKEGKKLFLQEESDGDCVKSCENFQASLSSCVATIMIEPGKTAAMGLPKKGGKAPAAICTKKDTPCMPDLEVNHQRCLGHKTKKALDKGYKMPGTLAQDCKMLKLNLEDCKNCPQLAAGGQSAYAAFTGGCMDQLNSYWQATHPNAGKSAIPGATGCTVH